VDLKAPQMEDARRGLLRRFGPTAGPWWRSLPELVDELTMHWQLRMVEPVERQGNTSVVLRCLRANDRVAMLKLSPDPTISSAEGEALRRWSATVHAPALWAEDSTRGALLLEAVGDGNPLSRSVANVPIEDIAVLLNELHQAPGTTIGEGIVPLTERVEFIFDFWRHRFWDTPHEPCTIPLERLHAGLNLARTLTTSASSSVLLHGDLHPGNVLRGPGRRLVAIDPRACVGDPAFDALDWVLYGTTDPVQWSERCDTLARLTGTEPERIWNWCAALAPGLAASKANQGKHLEAEALLALGR
jgi:streptomycin 6-kinase